MSTFMAKQALRSAVKSAGNTFNQMTGDAPAEASSSCSCLDRVYQLIADFSGTTSPEEKRRREFARNFRGMLQDGQVFTMVDYDKEEGTDLLAQMSKSVTSLFSGSRSDGKSTGVDAAGLSIVLCLDESDTVSLKWRTLELDRNKPRFQGSIPLHKVQVIEKTDNGNTCLICRDHHGKVLLNVESGEKDVCEQWKNGLIEAMAVLAPQIEENATESRGMLYRQQRYIELEKRKREREKQKAAMGNVGMKFTAQAMIDR